MARPCQASSVTRLVQTGVPTEAAETTTHPHLSHVTAKAPQACLDGGVRDALAAADGGDVGQHTAGIRIRVDRHVRR